MSWRKTSIPEQLPMYVVTSEATFEAVGVNSRRWSQRIAGWLLGLIPAAAATAYALTHREQVNAWTREQVPAESRPVLFGMAVLLAVLYVLLVLTATNVLVNRRVLGPDRFQVVQVPVTLLRANGGALAGMLRRATREPGVKAALDANSAQLVQASLLIGAKDADTDDVQHAHTLVEQVLTSPGVASTLPDTPRP